MRFGFCTYVKHLFGQDRAVQRATVNIQLKNYYYLPGIYVYILLLLMLDLPVPVWHCLVSCNLYLTPVLRIRDVYPGSRIRLFFIPDPASERSPSRIRLKEFLYFNPQKTKKMVSKLWKIWSKLFIPDPDADFLPIPDPGSRGQKGTGSRIRIRNIASPTCSHDRFFSDEEMKLLPDMINGKRPHSPSPHLNTSNGYGRQQIRIIFAMCRLRFT